MSSAAGMGRTGATERERAQGFFFLGLAVAAVGVAMAFQMGLNANFTADEMGLSPGQLGVLEAARESCGIWALLILAALAGLSEPVVGALVLLFFAAGLGGYSWVPSFPWLVGMSLVWSQGLHVWMPLPHSMALGLAEPGRKGFRLGRLQAAGSVGFGAGLVGAMVLSPLGMPMRPMYILAALAALVAVAACLRIPRRIRTPGPRLVFRRRYARYYLLSFLEGWRKQIFVCFAGFLLVRVYGATLTHLLVLHVVVQVILYKLAPRVGKIIDRIGERSVLVFYFSALVFLFMGYALIRVRLVLYVLLVLDSVLFVCATALTTYVDRLAPEHERTATLSMGVAMNHAAAVAMPLAGAVLWERLGYPATFAIGALAACLSVAVSLGLPRGDSPDSAGTAFGVSPAV